MCRSFVNIRRSKIHTGLQSSTFHETGHDSIMASNYSNWSLQKCNQHFDKYFRRFENRPISNKGMSVVKADQDRWIRFHFRSSDHSPHGCEIASFIHSLNLKVWYRLNTKISRGEICINTIHDTITSKRTDTLRGKY